MRTPRSRRGLPARQVSVLVARSNTALTMVETSTVAPSRRPPGEFPDPGRLLCLSRRHDSIGASREDGLILGVQIQKGAGVGERNRLGDLNIENSPNVPYDVRILLPAFEQIARMRSCRRSGRSIRMRVRARPLPRWLPSLFRRGTLLSLCGSHRRWGTGLFPAFRNLMASDRGVPAPRSARLASESCGAN